MWLLGEHNSLQLWLKSVFLLSAEDLEVTLRSLPHRSTSHNKAVFLPDQQENSAFKRLAWLGRSDPPTILSLWIRVNWLGTLITHAYRWSPLRWLSNYIYRSQQCTKRNYTWCVHLGAGIVGSILEFCLSQTATWSFCTPFTTESTSEKEKVNLLVVMIGPSYQGKQVAATVEARRTMLEKVWLQTIR